MPNETLPGDATTTIACITIQSGHSNNCRAFFYPSLYKMVLVDEVRTQKFDLGFAGSRLLERLLQSAGDAVGREDLIAYAWPERIVGQGSLNQQIYTLRQILGDEKARKIIQTLPRRGYLFHPDFVRRAVENISSGLASAEEGVIEPPPLTTIDSDESFALAESVLSANISTSNNASSGTENPHRITDTAQITANDLLAAASTTALNPEALFTPEIAFKPVKALKSEVQPQATVSSPRKTVHWQFMAAIGFALGVGFGSYFLSPASVNANAPVHEQMTVGELGIVYAVDNPALLEKLKARTHQLTMRLVKTSDSGTIFWRMAGTYYEALCVSNNAVGKALIVREDELNSVTDAQIRACFPSE